MARVAWAQGQGPLNPHPAMAHQLSSLTEEDDLPLPSVRSSSQSQRTDPSGSGSGQVDTDAIGRGLASQQLGSGASQNDVEMDDAAIAALAEQPLPPHFQFLLNQFKMQTDAQIASLQQQLNAKSAQDTFVDRVLKFSKLKPLPQFTGKGSAVQGNWTTWKEQLAMRAATVGIQLVADMPAAWLLSYLSPAVYTTLGEQISAVVLQDPVQLTWAALDKAVSAGNYLREDDTTLIPKLFQIRQQPDALGQLHTQQLLEKLPDKFREIDTPLHDVFKCAVLLNALHPVLRQQVSVPSAAGMVPPERSAAAVASASVGEVALASSSSSSRRGWCNYSVLASEVLQKAQQLEPSFAADFKKQPQQHSAANKRPRTNSAPSSSSHPAFTGGTQDKPFLPKAVIAELTAQGKCIGCVRQGMSAAEAPQYKECPKHFVPNGNGKGKGSGTPAVSAK